MVENDGKIEYSNLEKLQVRGIDMSIYPNPAKDYFYVLSKEDIPQYTELVLYNSSGKFVTNRPIYSREEKIHLENYPKGIYYYRIKVRDKTTQIGKLIVI
jgi:hypothetical protein